MKKLTLILATLTIAGFCLAETKATLRKDIDKLINAGTKGGMNLADGKVLIGGTDGKAAEQTLSGDMTISRAGVTAIGTGKVGADEIATGGVGADEIASGVITSSHFLTVTNGAAASGANTDSYSMGVPFSVHRITLKMTNEWTDVPGTIAYSGQKFCDLNAGVYAVAANVALVVTNIQGGVGLNADYNGDWSIGTTTAGTDADLTTTEANIIAKTATPAASSLGTTARGASSSFVIVDGSSGAVDLFFNMIVDDGEHDVTANASTNIVTGDAMLYIWDLGDLY